ncbi:integrase [Paenibacillus sp. Mc5Re-14]|uniref:integrase n=1 Tax=Paenibacillus sp. Mc5Re-14 TaxID=1030529 RepID=UPI000AEB7A09|nr:integrase [Paenibacillus sp. Mc5Re-14]
MTKFYSGLQRRQTLEELSNKYILESIESVTFKLGDLHDYKEMFRQLKRKGGNITGDFEDYLWVFKEEFSNFHFEFDCEVYGEINLALKCYSVQKIYNGISTQNVRQNLGHIKEAIRITRGFRLNELAHLEDAFNHFGIHKRFTMAASIREFLIFFNHRYKDAYCDLCANYKTKVSNVRELPNFHDILLFDLALDEYFKTCTSEEEKLQYYPIFLWWRLTRIIPMRPIEFYLLSRDCTMKDKEDRYWMVLPRRKNSSKYPGSLKITDTVQVNKEVFELVEDYKQLTSAYEAVSPYLISYKAYRKFVKLNTRERAQEKIGAFQFINMIDRFYDDVIIPKYGNLERVKPGDTRHFAFCNMMLQGFNMLTIARIGGHSSLETQLHYHKHLDHFAQSFVHHAAQKLRLKRKNLWRLNSELGTQAIIAKSKIYQASDFQEKYKVEHGYCTDHPSRCNVGDCRFCDYYFFSPEDEQLGLAWLIDCSKVLESRLKEQLELIRYLTKSMNYDCPTLMYQQSGQEKLSLACNELRRFMDQKAMVDSYLLEDEL